MNFIFQREQARQKKMRNEALRNAFAHVGFYAAFGLGGAGVLAYILENHSQDIYQGAKLLLCSACGGG